MSKSTVDYSIFKKNESNRELDPANLKKIKNSILYKNLLHIRPILVDKDMRIIDGQHRLEVAKLLKLPVFYEVDLTAIDEDIILLNAHQKKWVMEDYLNFYVAKGNKEYIMLRDFIKLKALKLSHALSIFNAAKGQFYTSFRAGTFKFPDNIENILEKIYYVKDFTNYLTPRISGYKGFILSVVFQRALVIFLAMPDIDYDELKRKVDINVGWVKKCNGEDGYVAMLKEIYNYKRRKSKAQDEEPNLFTAEAPVQAKDDMTYKSYAPDSKHIHLLQTPR